MAKKVDNRKSGKLQARRNERKEDAQIRQDLRNSKSANDQIDELNLRLGWGKGARKEREKLAKLV